MKTIVVVLAVLAVAVAGPAPEPQPQPQPQPPAATSAQQTQQGGGASAVGDQESQASETVSKRGAARLTPVSGNSIVDNTVSSAPPQSLQPQLTTYSGSQQLQQPQLTSYSSQQQQQQQQPQSQQQQLQQPLYAPHPYSFVAPQHQPSFFQYQPALPALPPLLHSKYHAPSKQHVLQYVPQPYFQVPQYQAPLMYLIPQPQPQQQAQPHHAQPSAAGQPEQAAHHHQHHHHQPQHPQQYVMVLSAPAAAAPVAASGFQYFNHPLLAQQPQQLITFYAGPQQGQVAQPQLHHLQLTQQQLQPQVHHQPQQSRFYPEQQQLVFQSPQPEQQQHDGPPHFVQKQQQQQQQQQQNSQSSPVGLEAPAPPTPASLVGTYGARLQHQPHQHAYKTIIKA
ncbi:hypothetical protein KUF71_022475 [Frankliniella fusca]|uniref:Uncharacterized protein n=1 Tax=Frankliniella fusca TaxID=407009 RepID=A0AAE1H2F8_9NEOP|nr:hypothetical protein KUF71_022475 [Frankliniella fusca]